MSSKLSWALALVVSVIWAVLAWAGYHLIVLMLQWLGLTPTWLNSFPELQALLFWLTGFTQGLESIVAVLCWLVWGIGQLVLCVMLWVLLRFGMTDRFAAITRRLRLPGNRLYHLYRREW